MFKRQFSLYTKEMKNVRVGLPSGHWTGMGLKENIDAYM